MYAIRSYYEQGAELTLDTLASGRTLELVQRLATLSHTEN